MNKQDLIYAVATKTGKKKAAKIYIDAVFDIMKNTIVNAGEIKIKHFGSFKSVLKPSYPGMNPATGEKLIVPARRKVVFVPSKDIRNTLRELSE